MSVHWVTSFSADLFEATGRGMLASFAAKGVEDVLHVYPEGMGAAPLGTTAPRIRRMPDLAGDPLLTTWLAKNADIIPVDKGGRWQGPCRCPRPDEPKCEGHHMPCPGAWFCRNAARWFRKIVALKHTLDNTGEADAIVWVDCDVVFTTRLTRGTVDSWFRGSDVFYLRGPGRKVWETGVVGTRGRAGREFLRDVLAAYTTGAFRKEKRWDDSNVMQSVSRRRPKTKFVDLAVGQSGHADVVPHSPLGRYMRHLKGHHSRVLKIVT